MKKILLGLGVVIVVVVIVFRAQILTTIKFYQFHHTNADLLAKGNITWSPLPFSSSAGYSTTDHLLVGETIQLTTPFDVKISREDGVVMAKGSAGKSIILHSRVNSTPELTAEISLDPPSEICQFLSKTSGTKACASDYNLFRAALELQKNDIQVFSSIKDKLNYTEIIKTRAGALRSNKISGFETSQVKGFLYHTGTNNYLGHLYSLQGDYLQGIQLISITQAEVGEILSSVSLVK